MIAPVFCPHPTAEGDLMSHRALCPRRVPSPGPIWIPGWWPNRFAVFEGNFVPATPVVRVEFEHSPASDRPREKSAKDKYNRWSLGQKSRKPPRSIAHSVELEKSPEP